MQITLDNISKRFGSQWIFKNISFVFEEGKSYAITGSNGAGKSTLLNIIVGKTPRTKGQLSYAMKGKKVDIDTVYQHFSIATTAMAVIEEFTLQELIRFHFRFRKPIDGISISEIAEIMDLSSERKKLISNFSSGMKQRVKIALAILSRSDVCILDEPGANLDNRSKQWYQKLLEKHLDSRTLIIASNDAEDYARCELKLDLSDYKN